MNPLRVLVVDDHRLFRQGLIGLMKTRADLVDVVGEAANGCEAFRMVERLHPDLVLMDILMPDVDGLQATSCILKKYPDTAVVMLTSSEEDLHLYQAIQCGAVGYLLKNLDADELFNLIRGIESGDAVMTQAMGARLLRLVAQPPQRSSQALEGLLTEREIDVLRLVSHGASNSKIAEELFISVNTVKVHLKNILEKLDLENRTQAAAYAINCGLAEDASV